MDSEHRRLLARATKAEDDVQLLRERLRPRTRRSTSERSANRRTKLTRGTRTSGATRDWLSSAT